MSVRRLCVGASLTLLLALTQTTDTQATRSPPEPAKADKSPRRPEAKVLNLGSRAPLTDPLYIINAGEGGGGGVRVGGSGGVSPEVQAALTLIVDALDRLDQRISRLEDHLLYSHPPITHNPIASPSPPPTDAVLATEEGNSVDRVGEAPPTTVPPPVPPCHNPNFSRIGDHCYYLSLSADHRANWQEASRSCRGMDAKLVEPVTPELFRNVTQHLASTDATAGFSFWTGGLFPGLSWRWSYAGTEVVVSPTFWSGQDSRGRPVAPGDISPGYCLSLAYVTSRSRYFYEADNCGSRKYYMCGQIEKTHRRSL